MTENFNPSIDSSLETDYRSIMTGFNKLSKNIPISQWSAPGDYFIKFSLYPETSLTVATDSTCLMTNL
jgi:hypothetical protein